MTYEKPFNMENALPNNRLKLTAHLAEFLSARSLA
jgi:hypothetical protein